MTAPVIAMLFAAQLMLLLHVAYMSKGIKRKWPLRAANLFNLAAVLTAVLSSYWKLL